jgi:hypothetical protein
MSFWMNADPSNELDECCQGVVTTDFYVVEISSSTGPVGVNFAVSTNSGASFVHTSDVNPGSAQVSRGAWHHVAGVYDGTKLVLYIDGKPFGKPTPHTGPISPMLPGSYLAFGSEDGRTTCSFCQHTRYFHGKIDDVRIYDRALSATEVGKLATVP